MKKTFWTGSQRVAYWLSLNGTIFFDILKKYDFSRFWLNFFFLKKI